MGVSQLDRTFLHIPTYGLGKGLIKYGNFSILTICPGAGTLPQEVGRVRQSCWKYAWT